MQGVETRVMENFIVSARKYRPTTFDSVVGQGSITATLKNAIKNKHLAQAYLFCGPRGVGKTTCARIFAKTINCQSLTPNVEPCNQCESCVSFNESRSYNVHELDAASNNSVDDIRQLIDKVRIPPPIGRYSVYVIDEVHMLSQAAFNAFLKTLEEPPRHAIFILATTEKHKILPTILSRCQIYDFNRIQINNIVQYLAKISKSEGNEYDPDGLNIIAQKADGALRDALSIYDQIVSFSNGKVTYENVIQSLNVLDYEYYFRLTDAFLNENIQEALLILDEVLSKGFNIPSFIEGLGKHFRDLLVSKDKATIRLLEVGENIRNKYLAQTATCSIDFLYDSMEILADCEIHLKERRNQRLFLEITFAKLCRLSGKKKTSPSIAEATINAPVPQKSQTESKPQATPSPQPSIKQNTTIAPSTGPQTSVSMPSLKEMLNGLQQGTTYNTPSVTTTTTSSPRSLRNQTFTAEQLKNAYEKFVESIKNTHVRFYSALHQTPVIEGEHTLVIEFLNQTVLDDFQQELKNNLQQYLCNELSNDNIVVKTIITQDEHRPNIPYTGEERLKYLMNKNAAVDKLKQQLNLDLE